ncbi:hypothetical protein [Clostridium aminobutyricum]|uniref:Uncharacterized protein n=1 Tax=Clostridium aminobutyricum TaxID=33953 RepID=A0A939IGD7_CLOAM|nr:hypothetical protein [Clostridium aminobutyricum]MBN7773140.1 hypothetical protein [Clostridium aminobutyricum]
MTIYRALGGVNRTVKQQYRGVGGVNREVKEQYRGVGGVNRKVFSADTFLYNQGDSQTALTGGWEKEYYRTNSGAGTLSLDASYMTVVCNAISSNGQIVVIGTLNKIDVTRYRSMAVTFDVVTQSGGVGTDYFFAIVNSKLTAGTTIPIATPVASGVLPTNTVTRTDAEIAVDISSISGSYYVVLESYSSTSAQSTIRIKSIKLNI